MLEVHAGILVAGQRPVARDQRRLGQRWNPGQPQPRRYRALVHDAVGGQGRVLLVQGDHPARQPLVLKRLAQDPGGDDGPAVVGEAKCAGVAERCHLR